MFVLVSLSQIVKHSTISRWFYKLLFPHQHHHPVCLFNYYNFTFFCYHFVFLTLFTNIIQIEYTGHSKAMKILILFLSFFFSLVEVFFTHHGDDDTATCTCFSFFFVKTTTTTTLIFFFLLKKLVLSAAFIQIFKAINYKNLLKYKWMLSFFSPLFHCE